MDESKNERMTNGGGRDVKSRAVKEGSGRIKRMRRQATVRIKDQSVDDGQKRYRMIV